MKDPAALLALGRGRYRPWLAVGRALALVLMAAVTASAQVVPWTVAVTQTLDPLAAGFCGAIHLTVFDAASKGVPRGRLGFLVTMADFDIAVAGTGVVAHQIDASHWEACACQGAPAGSMGTVTATYPAQSLPAAARVPGMIVEKTTTFTVAPRKGPVNPPACLTAYTAASPATTAPVNAAITSPAPGSALAGTSATFTWTAGTGGSNYWLDVGTAAGQGNITASGAVTGLSHTVTGLPMNGSTVYVQLWTFSGGAWQAPVRYTYTAGPSSAASGTGGAGAAVTPLGRPVAVATTAARTPPAAAPVNAVLVSPAPGSTLSGPAATFTWSAAAGASNYWLDVGTASGQGNIAASGAVATLSHAVTGLPTDGSTVHAQVWTFKGGVWQSPVAATYKAAALEQRAVLMAPTPGSTLSGASATFTWKTGIGASSYWLDVGTAPGQGNLAASGALSTLSHAVTGLPTDGSTVYVQVWTFAGGAWLSPLRYTYVSGP